MAFSENNKKYEKRHSIKFFNLIFLTILNWIFAVKIKLEIDKKSSSIINFVIRDFKNQVQIDKGDRIKMQVNHGL